MKEIKVLHIVNISFVIPYFLGKQMNWFTQKGYTEYVICSPSSELALFSKQYAFEYKEIEILRKISIFKDLKAVFSTIKYIKRINATIVTGHTPKGGLIAMLAAWLCRVPVRIYLRHGLVYETSTGMKRLLLIFIDRLASKLSTKIVCVSPSVAKRSIEDRLNSPEKQVVLANGTCNGIDVERFCSDRVDRVRVDEMKNNLGIEKGDFIIGFTGRLVKDKGIIELVRAYKNLRNEYNNVKLMLVGMLEIRDALPEDVVKTITDDDGIISTGYVEFSSIEYYYAMMDVFVLPSYREGFPTSVLEASSMSIPVITTRVTGCCDSIIDGVTGLFVGHDEHELMDALLSLYKDPSLRGQMGKAGREFVAENFEQSIIWKEIEKLYIQ